MLVRMWAWGEQDLQGMAHCTAYLSCKLGGLWPHYWAFSLPQLGRLLGFSLKRFVESLRLEIDL